MSFTVNRVERGLYRDSVALMRISRELSAMPGVESAAVILGTPANKALLREAGLLAAEGESAGANDLVVALRFSGAERAAPTLDAAMRLIAEKPVSEPRIPRARTLGAALDMLSDANLALISVPGQFAALEARKALERGLHALVFSDNVSLEDEVALKRLALEKDLFLMGPDCGTALIAGTPLAFANVVPRGDIGIVSASGTGLQEVSSLIARLGGGVSHGIGVGGRDLDARVGALGTLAGIDVLEEDPATAKIVLISKPPAPQIARRVLERVQASYKPCIVCFLGSNEPGLARTLREAAERATGKELSWPERPAVSKLSHGHVCGLYCGGTLCGEAEVLFEQAGLAGHRFIDLGADEFTRGRPHPMIAPELRNEHIAGALQDAEVGAILVDVVIGFGAHENPAGVLVEGLRGAEKPVVASVTGTDADPQGWSQQAAILRRARVIVAPSNAHAAQFAASLFT